MKCLSRVDGFAGRMGCVLMLVLGLLALPASAADAPSTPPAVTLEDLIQRGQANAKLAKAGQLKMTWSTLYVAGSTMLQLDTLADGARAHQTLYVVKNATQRAKVFSIIETSNAWYAWDMNKPLGKYRPFEAPLSFPLAYDLLLNSKSPFLSAEQAKEIKSISGNVAVVSIVMTKAQREAIQAEIDRARVMGEDLDDDPALAAKMQQRRHELQNAMNTESTVHVDVASGMILEGYNQDFRWEIHGVALNPPYKPTEFDATKEKWNDHTRDLTTQGKLTDWVMISSAPLAQAPTIAAMSKAMDLCLFNITTGEIRRVPRLQSRGVALCFSKDRKKVYTSGPDSVYEINLSTGNSRRIASELSARFLFPSASMSPDGKQLTGAYPLGKFLNQPAIIDLATGKESGVGNPENLSEVNWLPDGKGLIMTSVDNSNQPAQSNLVKMDLKGNTQTLCPGTHPQVIAGKNRILFQQADGLWHTCDLEGKDIQRYAGGMQGFESPAISPDGSRILWMHPVAGQLPKVSITDYNSPTPRDLNPGPGLWANPIWR